MADKQKSDESVTDGSVHDAAPMGGSTPHPSQDDLNPAFAGEQQPKNLPEGFEDGQDENAVDAGDPKLTGVEPDHDAEAKSSNPTADAAAAESGSGSGSGGKRAAKKS